MSASCKFDRRWVWFGVGLYREHQVCDIHLPFTLITVRWGYDA